MPVRKRRQKDWWVSDFALLLVGFKWYHGSEGVIVSWSKRCIIIILATIISTNQSVILKEMLHIVTMFLLPLLGQDLTSSSVSSDGAWSLSRSIWKHTTTCHHTPATSTHTSHDMSTHTSAMSTHTSHNMSTHTPAMSTRNSHVMSTHIHTLVVSYVNTHTSHVNT